MDFTSRMLRLLEAVRRERNGLAADTMRYYGARYGLNYGVGLSALRRIARAQTPDHAFARYLYQQDVRELQLVALWIADPARLVGEELDFWALRLKNSELAEEAAMALLGRTPHIAPLFDAWTREEAPQLLQYAALIGAARNRQTTALDASSPASHCSLSSLLDRTAEVVRRNPDDRLTAQGAVTLLVALAHNNENRCAVLRTIGSLGTSPAADLIHGETAWQLEA